MDLKGNSYVCSLYLFLLCMYVYIIYECVYMCNLSSLWRIKIHIKMCAVLNIDCGLYMCSLTIA